MNRPAIAGAQCCLSKCEEKTIKSVVYAKSEKEILIIFCDGTFARIEGEGFEDDCIVRSASHIMHRTLAMREYDQEVLQQILPAELLAEWRQELADEQEKNKARQEKSDRELYEILKAKFEGKQ